MTPIQRMRRRFIAVFAVLGVICIALILYLSWPGSSRSSQLNEEKELKTQLDLKQLGAAPLHGIEKKLSDSREQINELYKDRVANRWSVISERVQKIAQETGVAAQNIRYSADKTGLPDLQRVKIETTVSGDYSKIPRFINALERDKMLFLITQLSLNAQEGGVVQVQIKFDTFLKETA